MAGEEPQRTGELTLCLIGAFEVRRAGVRVPSSTIGSRKARTLLKILAVERGHRVHIDRIADALWPGEVPQRPAEGVATLVSRLRAALGSGIVDGDRDGYRLGVPPAVDVDLVRAGIGLTEARARLGAGEPALAMAAVARALTVLDDGAALTEDIDADWARPARDEATALLRQARHTGAEAALAIDDPARARDLAMATTVADPYDEAAYRLLMRAQAALGEPARALATYERLRAVLADDFGVDPSPETREIHLAILRERPASIGPAHTSEPARASGPALTSQSPASGTAHAPMVGRDAQLARATALWAAATAGSPGLLLITGEAGIGKTRLATALVDVATRTGGDVLSARCYATERSLFLQPFVEALGQHAARSNPAVLVTAARDATGTLATLIPQIAALLDREPDQRWGAEQHGDVARRQAYDAVARYLHRLASTPVLLVLDDLHNAGLATVELLHYMIRQAGNARLLVVATIRDDEGADGLRALAEVATRVDLGPLPDHAVAELARDAGHAELASGIVSRTRGHTLFVVESLRALTVGEHGMPESLQAAVLARVRGTGEATGELLRAAAVLGAPIDPGTLARMLDIPPLTATARCEQALDARLLVVADRAYEFANDLIREVLYESMPAPTLVAYHRRAADLLGDRPEAVAGHAAAAGDWARAARAWLVAGERAAARAAVTDAEALLTRALDAAGRGEDLEVTGRAYLARGRARDAMTSYPLAYADLRAAVDLARQAGDRRLEMMTLREMAGDVPVALGLPMSWCAANLHSGLRIAESLGDRATESDLLARLAVLTANRLQFIESLSFGHRAVHAARASGDDRALALALDGLKTGYAYLGEVGDLAPILDELEPLLRRQGDLWRLQWALHEGSFAALAAGRFDEALDRVETAREINRRSGYVAYEGWFVGQLGWIYRLRGDLDRALEHGRRALALTSDSTHAWWRSAACAQLASTLLAAGDPAAAIPLLIEGREHASHGGAEAYLLSCVGPLAEATGSRPLLDEADALLAGIAAPAGSAWLLGAEAYLSVARAWLARGDPRRALAVIAPLRAAADRTGWGWIQRAGDEFTAIAHDAVR